MALKFRLKGLAETFVDTITCPCCSAVGVDDQNFIAAPIPWYVIRRGISMPTVIVDLTAEEIAIAHQMFKTGKKSIFIRLFCSKQMQRFLNFNGRRS
jgi:hypothetical protein